MATHHKDEALPPRRNMGEGAKGRLTGPAPPSVPHEEPVMEVVPPEPNMADEVGDTDYTHGDATRVREETDTVRDVRDNDDKAGREGRHRYTKS